MTLEEMEALLERVRTAQTTREDAAVVGSALVALLRVQQTMFETLGAIEQSGLLIKREDVAESQH
jgi:hypothetical protein